MRKTVLPNGIRVLSEPLTEFASATVGIWVEVGSRYESAEQSGISHFLEHLFFKGTARRSAQEIAQTIDGVGGVLNAFTDREYTCYHAKVLKEDLPLAFDVLSDVFLNAQFPDDEIERERGVVLSEISEGEDSPDQYIHILFDRDFWPGHPLSRPIYGSAETVSSFGRANLVDFVKSHYRPNRILVAGAGALDHDWLVERVEREFGGLAGEASTPALTVPSVSTGFRAHHRALEQVQMLIGLPGLARADERRYAGLILNTVLGDGMSSRLFQELRERRGLAYSVASFFASFLKAGYMAIYAGLPGTAVAEAIEAVRGELLALARSGLTPEELTRAKSQIRGNMLLSLESSGSRMIRLAYNEIFYGRHIEPSEVASAIFAVTPEDVLSLAQQLFENEAMSVTLLGNTDQVSVDPAALRLA